MPVACSQSVLAGSDGSVYYTPAGTKFCLEDFVDFPDGDDITVPSQHDFRVGDPVNFFEEDGGALDKALTASTESNGVYTLTTYYVVAKTATTIQVSATKGGTAISLAGDGGTGSANSAGHIKIQYGPAEASCMVREWSCSFEREELDVTTLPCGVTSNEASKYASFRKTTPGYVSATGEMTIYFIDDDTALSNRMLDNIMLRSQEGAAVRLFVNTIANSAGDAPELSASNYIEAEVRLTSMEVGVNPDDPTEASVGFTIQNPTHLFKTSLV